MRYEDHTFDGETIKLDGNEYIRCRFVNCRLEYGGGALVWEPMGVEDSNVSYSGGAAIAIGIFRTLTEAVYASAPVGSMLNFGDAWFQRVEEGPDPEKMVTPHRPIDG